jgi:hypothetical protein
MKQQPKQEEYTLNKWTPERISGVLGGLHITQEALRFLCTTTQSHKLPHSIASRSKYYK